MTPKSTHVVAVFVCCLFLAVTGFGQSINATVGGNVADASGALIPGVTVTATNVGTNIANTTVTNETGTYNFPALQPGTYKVTAELPGFQTQTFTDVQLGGAQQVKLNFNLQVAAAAGTNVEVTVAADTILATTSNSIGTILPEYRVRDLPTVAGNVFNIVQNMPGVQRNDGGTFGYMAGGRLGDVNATRDGVNVNDGRYENGAWSTVYSSPDMIEEVKVIVAPIDAETSRGSGQVSMITRSGTNTLRGSVFWNNHNSALDANDWFNNRNNIAKSYDNRNQYGARLGGPIIKNKTFFFLFFNGQRDVKKNQANGLTYTDMAKAGIFRYWPGVDNQNASGANPSVDLNGNPRIPNGVTSAPFVTDPSQPAAIGLFGTCNYKGAPVPNCKTFSDPNRTSISTIKFLQEQFSRMPSPNRFTSTGSGLGLLSGDGLNTAIHTFVRRQDGLDQTNGNSDEINRDQYNARIDHNFNSKHKLSIIGTHEKTWGTATQAGLRAFPNAYDGLAVKRPVVYSIQFTSTLTSSMLNQLRLSKSGSNNWQWASGNRNDDIGAEARSFMPVSNGVPYRVVFAGTANLDQISPFASIGGFGTWREGINPRYSVGDDLSWTVRKHAFKVGYEYRRSQSNGFNDPDYTPRVTIGAGGTNAAVLSSAANEGGFTGLSTPNATLAKNLLYNLSGSVNEIRQAFGVVSAKDTALVPNPAIRNNAHWNYQSEMSAYFKDDWKFRSDLTLNVGIHWEWYGQPYEHNGLAARVVGDDSTFLKVNCTSTPGVANSSVCTNLAQVQFVGKNSTHPEIGSYVNGNDNNNFAPAIGFAWNVPWFGKGKTVIRSGYGINYEGALRNFITVDSNINTVPGINQIANGNGLPFVPQTYTTIGTVQLPIPLPSGTATTAPFTVQPTQRTLGITTYKHVSPYTQNWNFEIQREVAKNTTVEIRYVGTKGTKLWYAVDINQLNWLKTDGSSALFQAFNTARAGGESALLDQIFNGIALTGGCGVVNGSTCTGARTLRSNTTTRQQLANGSFGAFLNSLNTNLQYIGGPTDSGSILRRAGLPDNYLVPDPQYSSVNIEGNHQTSTYHSLNLQVTRRLTNGFTNTTTYIWSKAMGYPAAGDAPDPNNRADLNSLQAVDHKHQISSNGSYQLPFGTGQSLLGNAPNWLQNIVGKWQLGGIMNFTTGAPLVLTTGTTGTNGINTITNVSAKPVVVGSIPKNIGKVTKLANGVTYFAGLQQITDPTFAQISPNCVAAGSCDNLYASGYTNKAIADANGNPFLVNPQPGSDGSLGRDVFRGPSRFDLDMNLVKRFRITETKEFEFRMDVVNVLNHPNFAAPSAANLSINNAGNIGTITALGSGTNIGGNGGLRSIVFNTRINF
jgi:Carboxypeptidase regulatory-like domain